MAKSKSVGRANAIKIVMGETKPADEMYEEMDGTDNEPGSNEAPEPSKGSESQNEEVQSAVCNSLSDAADGLEAIAEKASPEDHNAILKIVDDIRKMVIKADGRVEEPSAEEIEKDAKPEKPEVGPSPIGTIY